MLAYDTNALLPLFFILFLFSSTATGCCMVCDVDGANGAIKVPSTVEGRKNLVYRRLGKKDATAVSRSGWTQQDEDILYVILFIAGSVSGKWVHKKKHRQPFHRTVTCSDIAFALAALRYHAGRWKTGRSATEKKSRICGAENTQMKRCYKELKDELTKLREIGRPAGVSGEDDKWAEMGNWMDIQIELREKTKEGALYTGRKGKVKKEPVVTAATISSFLPDDDDDFNVADAVFAMI